MASRDNYTFANQSSIPAGLRDRLGPFFRSWDDVHNTDNHHYLNLFTPQGSLQFGQKVTGRDAIRAFRAAMVDPVKGPVVELEHTLGKCFVLAGGAGAGKEEIIVNGSIWYKLRNGRRVDCDFSSWMVLVEGEGGGELQAEWYEVYLDAYELMTAIKEMNEKEGQ